MAVTNLPFIQGIMIRYGMTTYLIVGLLGNICNCIIFSQPAHRRKPSSIFFLSLSIFGMLHLTWSLTPLIYTLDHADLQTQSVFYCKARAYGTHVFGQCLRSAIVFSSLDRFLITRTSVRIRALNSVQMAVKLVLIVFVAWFIIAIHLPILLDIRNGVCGIVGLYKLIYGFYQITVCAILPLVLMSIFGILTIRSLYQRHAGHRHAKQRDRYLMRMVMAEVIVYIITVAPNSINLIYVSATYYTVGKSTQRLEIESFMSFLSQFLIYFIGVTPFYLFMLTSKPFRNEFIHLLIKCRNKYIRHRVRIVPLNEPNILPT